jgi:hypothetical protein
MDKLKSPKGPPRKYKVQLGMYGLGYIREGFPVNRVALIALPRTKSTLAATYVWESPFLDLLPLVEEAFADTTRRKQMARSVQGGAGGWHDVPAAPDDSECYFCPFYRSQSQGDIGCPGPVRQS